MKSIVRILLVGAVAVTAIGVSAAPSEAAKRVKPGTYQGQLCTIPSTAPNVSLIVFWGYEKKMDLIGLGLCAAVVPCGLHVRRSPRRSTGPSFGAALLL